MDTVQLETFFAVITHKNFSRAAEALNVSQPTVSARIKNLEYELACKLFEKDGKNVTLSKEGKIFLEYAKNIMANMKHSLEATRHSKYQHIKVGFSPAFSYSYFTELINSILSIENIEVSIYEGKDSLSLNEMFMDRELDLIFTRNSYTQQPDIVSEFLFDGQLVLICGKNHHFMDKEIILPEDLEGETLICYQRHTAIWAEIEEQLVGVPNIKRFEVGNNEMVKSIVGSGIGVGITTALSLNEYDRMKVETKQLKKIDMIPNNIYVQYRKNSLIEEPVKKIIYSVINHEIQQ
ncbi:LysR family transcriptional regulator [Niallia sp. Krafla_26]|uniref:LysR family transcriptional regulator n=1 Tax=Niallia sp. Krafla_26 TaxID=3064703 RepID=UPI003D167E6A